MPAPTIPEQGFMRLPDIIGRRAVTEAEALANRSKKRRPRRARPAAQGVLPMSASTWWAGIKVGRYPAPVRLGPGVTAWNAADIRALVDRLARGGGR